MTFVSPDCLEAMRQCDHALQQLEPFFIDGVYLTLVVRNSNDPDGYIVKTKDDLAEVAETLQMAIAKEQEES